MCLGAVGNNLAEGRIMAKRRARWASVPGFGCWSVGGGPVPARDPQFMPAMGMKGLGLGSPFQRVWEVQAAGAHSGAQVQASIALVLDPRGTAF